MTDRWPMAPVMVLGLAAMIVANACAFAKDPLAKSASWHTPSPTETIQIIRQTLDTAGIAADKTDRVVESWTTAIEGNDADPLTAFVDAMTLVFPEVDKIIRAGTEELSQAAQLIESAGWISARPTTISPIVVASVRTWVARELVRRRLYDEALPVFDNVEPTDCIDPASVMFYRGVCRHSLLMKNESLQDLRRLLENEEDSPIRFVRTAHLMVEDIKPLKTDSLDEISRLMTDVTRRLDLGRANEDVTKREQTIIDKLTKLIEKMEEQQQQQQQQQQQSSSDGQSGGGGNAKPMDDSRIAGASGQGDVDKKKIGDRDGWGNLPPAEREESLQQISRDLPTHYREAIEAYFRKLAVDQTAK